ncbi:uncharacterized protein A4U43_C08F12750 [Asparagus officinalis]|nr:uncharacterized protein A4U43_C08F12750 [Asparagus officinalis]
MVGGAKDAVRRRGGSEGTTNSTRLRQRAVVRLRRCERWFRAREKKNRGDGGSIRNNPRQRVVPQAGGPVGGGANPHDLSNRFGVDSDSEGEEDIAFGRSND